MITIQKSISTKKRHWVQIPHKYLPGEEEFSITHDVEKGDILLLAPHDMYLTLENLINIKEFLCKVAYQIAEDQKNCTRT